MYSWSDNHQRHYSHQCYQGNLRLQSPQVRALVSVPDGDMLSVFQVPSAQGDSDGDHLPAAGPDDNRLRGQLHGRQLQAER